MAGLIKSKEWHDANTLIGQVCRIQEINDALRHADKGALRELGHDKINELAAVIMDVCIQTRDNYE